MDSNKIRKDIFQAFATLVEEELESDIKISYIQTGEEIEYIVQTNNNTLGFFLSCFQTLQEKYESGEIDRVEFIRRLKNSRDNN